MSISRKEPTIKETLNTLDSEIKKRPTLLQVVTLILTVAGLGLSILFFMLDTQTNQIKAETKCIVNTALTDYQDKEFARWNNRKKSIIEEILAKVKDSFRK